MVQIFSFILGSLFTLSSYKLFKVTYKVYPYFRKKSTFLYKSYSYKIGIITGCTDGLGKQYAKYLFRKDYNLILVGRNPVKLNNTKQQLLALEKLYENQYQINKPQIKTIEYDFNKNQLQNNKQLITQLKKQVSQIINNLNYRQPIDIELGFINSCGQSHISKYQQTSLQQIKRINSINLNSFHAISQAVFQIKKNVAQIIKQKSGYNGQFLFQKVFFINVSSIVGQYPNKYSSIYSATKAYCSNVMKVLNHQKQLNNSKSRTFSLFNRTKNNDKFYLLNLTPMYIKTKMIRYLQSWDIAQPSQIVQGSFKLLQENRTQGTGCIKHQLLKQFPYIVKKQFNQRLQKAFQLKKKLLQLQNRRKQRKINLNLNLNCQQKQNKTK